MFKNYLKIAWRSIVRRKSSSFINIVGLATGMMVCILIFLWVDHELSYDKFNEHADDIYRVVENQYYANGQIFPVAVTPTALSPALKEQFPEIIKSTRFAFQNRTFKYGEKIFNEEGASVDPDFFDIFTIPFIKGDPQTALSNPQSAVLTEQLAAKYFDAEEPIGKTLRVDNSEDLVVTGVIKNIPDNSHFHVDYLGRFTSEDVWGSNWLYTYVRLQEGTPSPEVNHKIIDLIKKNKENSVTEIYLQPLTKIHLYSSGKYTADIGGHGDIRYVQIFSIVAIFVLIIACINFVNLATARSERRAREVGLRKVVGAQRHQLIRQFFGEAILMSLLAFIVALLLTEMLLPVFNDLSGKTLSLDQWRVEFLFGFLGIVIFSGLVSGSYPALYLSSFSPLQTLKGRKGIAPTGSLFRKILVVMQFTLSVMMIIGTIVVSRQIDYIRNKNLGLEKENLAYVWMPGKFREKYETAKHELLKNPSIVSVTATSQLPTYVASSTSGWDWQGKNPDDNVLMHFILVDYDYLQTFKMALAEGRFFSPEFATDSLAAVVNETAVEVMGMTSPIGQRLSIGRNNLHIVGVVKDFHFKPIRTKIEPMVLLLTQNRFNIMVLKISPGNIPSTVDYIKDVYKKFDAETPFELSFLDERYERLYRTEQRIGSISAYFAVVAILISCLGLYGLAAFMAEQRTKEIGIRKVLGATISHIFLLLSRNFVLLVVLANLIAWPLAYFVMSKWLQNYAYHTSLQVAIFAIAAIVTVAIVLLTICTQTIRAARANPVESLRYE
ncbi:MAG: ABC transporter permease [bacterium]